MSHHTDHYAVLGIATTATRAQVRAAYRRLARELHPDAKAGEAADPAATRRFARVSHAYEILSDPARRRAYDTRGTWGRFAAPGTGGPMSVDLEGANAASPYHVDLGHHSDFYQAGDPLTVREAAELVHRHPAWLRRAIRTRRLPAAREDGLYLLRRRDVERLDRTAPRRVPRPAPEPEREEEATAEA